MTTPVPTPTTEPPADEKPEAVTLEQVNAAINNALTAREKRFAAAVEKTVADTVGKAFAAQQKPADEPAADARGKAGETPGEKLLREKLEKLEAKYVEAEARTRATEEKARRDAARGDLRAALDAKGVKGAKAAALISHLEATGAVRFAEDGKPELAVARSRAKGAPAEEMLFTLAAGVEDWTKTPEAAEFLPAPSAPATRANPFQPPGPRRAAQTYAVPAASDDEMARRAVESLAAQGVDVLEAYRR
jgi:hypothetical protein